MSINPIVATTPKPDLQPGLAPAACPGTPSVTLMSPDRVEKSNLWGNSKGNFYDADIVRNARIGAHKIAAGAIAATVGVAERLDPVLGRLGSKIATAAGSAARATLPIAADALGAGSFVIAIQRPAGESEAELAKTRALDAAGRQHMSLIAHPGAEERLHTTFPGQRVDGGPEHTAQPVHTSTAKDSILVTPAKTHVKPSHTGHAPPDLRGLLRPTGTAIHLPHAADQLTLAKKEKIVTPEHAAYLSPSGTLLNAEKAVIPIEKLTKYALNPDHPRGADKARVFKAALGYDQSNHGNLETQIRTGIENESAIPGDVTKDGVTFAVDVPVEGPTGAATVRTGWMYREGSDIPRLTSLWVK